MGTNYARQQVARISRNKIFRALLLLGVLGFIAYNALPSLSSLSNLFLREEEVVNAADLPEFYEDGRPYVMAVAEELFDTGYYVESDGKAKYYYYAFWAEDQYIICRVPTSFIEDDYYDYELHGEISVRSSMEAGLLQDIAGEIASSAGMTTSRARNLVSDYIIYVGTRTAAQVVASLAAVAAALIVAWIVVCISNIADYRTGRAYKKLADGMSSAEQVNEDLSCDIEYDRITIKRKDMLITRGWIAKQEFATFKVFRKGRLIWLYKTVTRHRTNGIPTGKTYAVTLCFDNGRTVSFTARLQEVDDLLLKIADDCPGVVCGYSDELAELYRRDRAAFRARHQASGA
jgi:hypothetical protein